MGSDNRTEQNPAGSISQEMDSPEEMEILLDYSYYKIDISKLIEIFPTSFHC